MLWLLLVFIGKRLTSFTVDWNWKILTHHTRPKSEVVTLKEHLKGLPKVVEFMEKHVVSTPYSMSIQRC